MKRRTAESPYAKAVAEAERNSQYFVARQLKATVPHFRVKLDQDIAELQIAWRDMNDDEKRILIAETIRKGKNFVRQVIMPRQENLSGPSHARDICAERTRQLDALYRVMTAEQRAEYDRGAA